MDDSDIVFIGDSYQASVDGSTDNCDDFEELKVGIEAKPDEMVASSTSSTGSSVSQYMSAFNRLFLTPDLEDHLKNKAFSCGLRPRGFRGLCWAHWLKLLPGSEPSAWLVEWRMRREEYSALQDKHCFDNRCDPSYDPLLNNPLSQDDSSPWNVYFKNVELKKEIERDVVRTSPDSDLFKEEAVRTTMINILFIYCKEHPTLSYRQGMHELLGSVFLVWKGDVDNCNHLLRGTSAVDGNIRVFRELMNQNFVEHDVYFIFEKVMEHMWDWYYIPERPSSSRPRTKLRAQPQAPFLSHGDLDDVSHCNAIRRLRNMWLNILQLHDQELFDHLENLHILPTTFGVNWTKLLFSRQFKAYLSLWDAILASQFLLVDYIVVAMVLSIRSMLISGDSNLCNSLLVSRYPSNVRVDYVISFALHLQDSFRFPKPRGSPFQVAREENPVTGLSPLQSAEECDIIVGSFDVLSREELIPKFSSTEGTVRDSFELMEASLNELRHALRQNQPPVSGNVMNAFRRVEGNFQSLGRQLGMRTSESSGSNLRRNRYSLAFDALGLVDNSDGKIAKS